MASITNLERKYVQVQYVLHRIQERMKKLMLTGRRIDVMSAEFEQTPRGHETVQTQQIAFMGLND
jgi:hypothetical protein